MIINTKQFMFVAVMALSMLLASNSYAQSFPAFPMSFWGGVTINGSPAPAGTTVRAYYGTQLAGEVVLQETSIYGYNSPIKQKLVIASGSGAITFKTQAAGFNGGSETEGTTPVSHSTFQEGQTIEKDLTFTIPIPTPPPSPNGGGGGGGGGGGSFVPTPTPTPALSGTLLNEKADITKDGKVDILDFNVLIVNWGGTSSTSADLNSDGRVDIIDFNMLMVAWPK